MKFKKGDKIVNEVCGQNIFGIVQEVFDNGDLLIRNERIGKWRADPEKCFLFDNYNK